MLESIVKVYEKITLRNPMFIQGVTGMGFVGDIVAMHIIRSLGAKKFGEIRSPFFQDVAITTADGDVQFPAMEFYHWQAESLNDLIILYGNTQALTSYGQYELCGKILDTVQGLGCRLVVGVGGLGRNPSVGRPRVYCTATDLETLDRVMRDGLSIVQGHVFGMSGLLVGLAGARGMKGFCLLAETAGVYPDVVAARAILDKLNGILGLRIDLEDLERTVESVSRTQPSEAFRKKIERDRV